MRRKFFALIFVGFLTMILSIAVNANPDGPKFIDPVQYSEHRIGSDVTVSWKAPNSSYGEVSYYTVAVRGFKMKENVTLSNAGSVVIPSVKFPSTVRSVNIDGAELLKYEDYKKYRISVCAVMKDGTQRWSDHRYFYISIHNTPLNMPISFHIYNGFTVASKDQIYYSCQNWNEELNVGQEIMNTYPYTQGTNKMYKSLDGENIVTKGALGDSAPLMVTTTWHYSSGPNIYRLGEADIVVNANKAWSNSTSSDTYNLYNCMMHEMGHVVGLVDKYDSWASEWTMYGGCIEGEDKKITLAARDIINGIMLYD